MFKIQTKLLCMVIAMACASAEAADMDSAAEWQIKAEIKQLVDRYAMARDNLDAEGYANVFAENGSLIINGEAYTGRDVISARVEAADQSAIGMHVMSTSQITVLDETNATGIHYATVYGAIPDDSHSEGDVVGVAGFVTQGKYFDKYELTDEGWKISERRFQRVYVLAP